MTIAWLDHIPIEYPVDFLPPTGHPCRTFSASLSEAFFHRQDMQSKRGGNFRELVAALRRAGKLVADVHDMHDTYQYGGL